MLLELQSRIKHAIRSTIQTQWQMDAIPEIVLNQTPKIELGELATPICFELSRILKRAPRTIAEELIGKTGKIPGIEKIEIAGAGYINFFIDRAAALRASRVKGFDGNREKIIVEHTNINPNKAAHIGHLRNSAIGDTFVRILECAGRRVEVQNYIDNTGVQVADVIVGFKHLERKNLSQVKDLISQPKFDYYCWDLYAKVGAFYETEDPKHTLRGQTLKEIEEGNNDTADMAEAVAMAIVRTHIATMERINVRYHLLPRESDILHLEFWKTAFEQLKARQAIFLETDGKNAGCWVLRMDSEGYDEDKIIVRSNGTVTYVGKDIAYQLWKLGLLKQDFYYLPFLKYPNGSDLWVTTSQPTDASIRFGHADVVYNVIDVRQSYLQNVVRQGVLSLGYEKEARNSIHFSYEMVALSPACAAQLGIELSPEDQKKAHVEVSGRKGQGVKADDLLDTLENEARKEVRKRNPELSPGEANEISHQIAAGAVRYFLLKFTRNAIIAFDFKEALNFDGETGPYLQYATVRGNNILNKLREMDPDFQFDRIQQFLNDSKLPELLREANDIWDLLYLSLRLDEIAAQVIITLEPATLAKYTFSLAQRFSLFYHRHRILGEEDPAKRLFYLLVLDLVRESLTRALDMMGMQVPRRM